MIGNTVAEEAQNFEYANQDDLPVKQEFTKARKAGYAEEEVDSFVDDVILRYTEFLNKYNNLVYQYQLLQTAAKATENSAAESEPEAVTEAPAVEEVTVVDNTPLDTPTASRRAREIMDEAAAEASEHVTRALGRVERIENEALADAVQTRKEAQDILTAAEIHVENIVTAAQNEATALLAAANAAADEATAIRDQALQQRNSIFSRLELFYVSQLEDVRTQKSAGYLPVPEGVEPVVDVPVEANSEEFDSTEAEITSEETALETDFSTDEENR